MYMYLHRRTQEKQTKKKKEKKDENRHDGASTLTLCCENVYVSMYFSLRMYLLY